MAASDPPSGIPCEGSVQFWGAETLTPLLRAPGSARNSRAPRFWPRRGSGEGKHRERDLCSSCQRYPEATGCPQLAGHPGDATRLHRCQRKGKSLPCRRVASKDAKTGGRREIQPSEQPPGGQGGRNRPWPPVSLHPVSTARSRCPGAAAGSDPGRISGWERRLESLPAPPAALRERPQGSLRLIPGEPGGLLSSLVTGAGTLWVPPARRGGYGAHFVPWVSPTSTFWGAWLNCGAGNPPLQHSITLPHGERDVGVQSPLGAHTAPQNGCLGGSSLPNSRGGLSITCTAEPRDTRMGLGV